MAWYHDHAKIITEPTVKMYIFAGNSLAHGIFYTGKFGSHYD
jgi:hypothetical protein